MRIFARKNRFDQIVGAEGTLKSDINVTPFVDVMLVLLIIFMVSAPLLTTGVSVDLPQGKSSALPESEPLTISVDAGGKIFLRDKEIMREELFNMLKDLADLKDERIYLRADKSLSYSQVVEIMSTLTNAGFTKIALVMDGQVGNQ